MYRDNSLMPKEVVRLAVLGTLLQKGPRRYADLAAEVRHFISRIVGPSLDLMGTSLEMVRVEGLIEALDGTGMEDNALLGITDKGRASFAVLLRANVRAPSADGFNKLVVALKMRFLHLLDRDAQVEQMDGMIGLYETELTRLVDLAQSTAETPGHLSAWLANDMALVQSNLDWFMAVRSHL